MKHAFLTSKKWLVLSVLGFTLAACGSDEPQVNKATKPSAIQPSAVEGFTINAGENTSAPESDTIVLSVSVSKTAERSVRSVNWQQDQADALRATPQGAVDQDRFTVTLPQVEKTTALRFVVTVVDDLGRSVQDDVEVSVTDRISNQLPKAIILAPDKVSADLAAVVLDGCTSTDPDGTVVSYQWQRLQPGPPATLSFTTCKIDAPLNKAATSETDYVFQLTVVDNQGAQSPTAQVKVTQQAGAGNTPAMIQNVEVEPQPTYTGDVVQLNATATDADGNAIQYTWTQVQGDAVQLSSDMQNNTRFVAPARAQVLKFRLTAKDDSTELAMADTRLVEVNVQDRPVFSALTPQQCLQNPALEGCAAAIKLFIPSNAVTPALGVSPVVDSAGACTPDGSQSWPHFWGALHEHTAYSDGSPLTKPADVFKRVASKGLDFAFSTDHSDNMALPVPVTLADYPQFCITSPLACAFSDPTDPASNLMKWDSTAKQASAASTEQFTAMRGFEWTSDRFGHANVLFSRHYINPKTGPGYLLSMDAFWAWFLTTPDLGGGRDGVMIFNHPGREDALHSVLTQTPLQGDPAYTFNDFAYVSAADYRVAGVEVFGKGDEYDKGGKKGSWLGYALDKGWYLGAAGSEDHHGTMWGEASLPKTVLVARTRKPADLREALLARRFYAVAQNFNDLQVNLTATDSLRTYQMGSRISTPDREVNLEVSVTARPGRPLPLDSQNLQYEVLSSQADNSQTYQIYKTARGSKAAFRIPLRDRQDWLFVRIRDKASNSIVAVTSPIWIRPGSVPLPSCNPSR